MDLDIPRFPKFHITEIHVPEIIKIKGASLGRFTEHFKLVYRQPKVKTSLLRTNLKEFFTQEKYT